MEKKYSFKIVRAADTTALSDFRCGVQSMDAFIHDKVNGLAKFIQMGLSNLWIVFEGSKAVAFFALSKDALMLNGDDIHTIGNDEKKSAALPDQDEDKFWEREKYPALEIDYLAVCKEKRDNPNEHIGAYIIEEICRMARADFFSATLFLTVEALDTKDYSAVKFYRKCDFEFSEVGRIQNYNKMRYGEQPTTQRMYRVVIPSDAFADEEQPQ